VYISLTAGTSNKFYKMQIVAMSDKKSTFSLIQNWGPIGKAGQVKVSSFATAAEAIKEMEKIFKKKSGLAFADRNSATAVGGKYSIMKQRRQAAGGQEGKVTISLMWDNAHGQRNDLDLHVQCPSGEKISYANRNSQCGGTLDVDMQQGAPNPVENIFWGTPPKGTYEVTVVNYSQSAANDVAFTVSVTLNGTTRPLYEMTMPKNGVNEWGGQNRTTVPVTSFTV
jgi:predicted DNA-binding WGR domain protein